MTNAETKGSDGGMGGLDVPGHVPLKGNRFGVEWGAWSPVSRVRAHRNHLGQEEPPFGAFILFLMLK